jgi:CBS domain containing-hemolysin-like protein
MSTEVWLLLLVVFLIAANALFVAAEFAFVTVDRATVKAHAEQGDKRSGSLQRALAKLSTELSGAQLGITITSLVVGFIAEPSIAALLRGPLESMGFPEATALPVSFTLAFLIATSTQMVFGELVPKNWAIAEPLRVGRAVAGAQRGFTWFAGPLIRTLNGSANRIVRALGMEPREELASARTAAEFESIAQHSAARGTLDPTLAARLAHAADLRERTASDAMTPRTRAEFVAADTTIDELLELVERTGHARFPVFGEDVDEIVGVAHFRAAMAVPARSRRTTRAADIAIPASAVPSTMPLSAVLEFLRGGAQLAVVVDEYGGTDGIITLEDLVEEIVGEIQDEHDTTVSRYRKLGDGKWSLSGLLRPDEAADLISVSLPEAKESDTLGGLVTELLGRFPAVGDHVVVEALDLSQRDQDDVPARVSARVSVTRLDGRRVDRVMVQLAPEGVFSE